MGQFKGTFQRYEKKYLLDEKQYEMVLQSLEDKLTIDEYGRTSICNIYFDTPDYRLIRTSLDKPVYKEKLRLRSYGTPSGSDTVFVELKKKYKEVVYKRRVKLDLITAERYLYENIHPAKDSQIMREIDWFLTFYRCLQPTMYISYDRIAMYGSNDPELRVTFDWNLLYRKEELCLESGTWGNPILPDGYHLMELKLPGAMPLWLSHILNGMNLYPTSFSKYGRGYQLSLLENQKIRKGDIRYA